MLSRFGLFGPMVVAIVLAAGLSVGTTSTPTPVASPVPTTVSVMAQPSRAPVEFNPTNPAVEPGEVHWHPTTEAAFAAAKASNKPVLVFHMMGQLDHQFC